MVSLECAHATSLWCMGTHRHVTLPEEERSLLDGLIHGGTAPALTLTRARVSLHSGRSQVQKRTDEYIADAVMCSISTGCNIRQRYLDKGMHARLYEKERLVHHPGSQVTWGLT